MTGWAAVPVPFPAPARWLAAEATLAGDGHGGEGYDYTAAFNGTPQGERWWTDRWLLLAREQRQRG